MVTNFNQKDKFFVFLVAVFAFLSLYIVFDFFYKVTVLVYIWAALYSLVLVFSGAVYGFLTKMRNRSVVLGVSFPLAFGIFSRIILYYRFMQYPTGGPDTAVFYSSYSFLLLFLIVAVSNAIACRFVSLEENKGDSPISLSALFKSISSFLNKDNNFHISVSFIFMGISLLLAVFVVFGFFV